MNYINTTKLKRFEGSTCLVRLPLNVEDGDIRKSIRIMQSLKTLKELSRNKCKVVVLGHKGRPDLKRISDKEYRKKFSLKKISNYLSKKLNKNIYFFDEFDANKIKNKISKSKDGSIFVLENVRFLKGEVENSNNLAKKYSELADFYINDAFSVAHREEASISAVTKYLESYAGFHFKSEITSLRKLIKSQKHPLTLIIGGAKVGDKGGVIDKFIGVADKILIGGALATTYFAAKGLPVGDSLYDKKSIPKITEYLNNEKIILPVDFEIKNNSIFDIGIKTRELFDEIISKSKMIIWSGPMGMIENKKFSKGTHSVAKSIINSKTYSVAGGGETISFVLENKLNKGFSFLSSAGGAMLKFLAGEDLPGILALEEKNKNEKK